MQPAIFLANSGWEVERCLCIDTGMLSEHGESLNSVALSSHYCREIKSVCLVVASRAFCDLECVGSPYPHSPHSCEISHLQESLESCSRVLFAESSETVFVFNLVTSVLFTTPS